MFNVFFYLCLIDLIARHQVLGLTQIGDTLTRFESLVAVAGFNWTRRVAAQVRQTMQIELRLVIGCFEQAKRKVKRRDGFVVKAHSFARTPVLD